MLPFLYEVFCLLLWALTIDAQSSYSPVIRRIIENAKADGINLTSLPFAPAAFASIEAI